MRSSHIKHLCNQIKILIWNGHCTHFMDRSLSLLDTFSITESEFKFDWKNLPQRRNPHLQITLTLPPTLRTALSVSTPSKVGPGAGVGFRRPRGWRWWTRGRPARRRSPERPSAHRPSSTQGCTFAANNQLVKRLKLLDKSACSSVGSTHAD